MKTADIVGSVVLCLLTGSVSPAAAQDRSSPSAGRLLAAILQATEEANADRAKTGLRFFDVGRTSALLSTAFGRSVAVSEVRGSLLPGYREAVADSVKRCSPTGGPPCRLIGADAVLVSIDSVQATPQGVRVAVTWRDNAANPRWGLYGIEWEMVFEQRGGDWVLLSHQVRRMS